MDEKHTSPNRSASGSPFTKSLMLPLTIHSDTITNRFSDIVTPNSGSMFGWRRDIHATTSLQNLYGTQSVANSQQVKGTNNNSLFWPARGSSPFGIPSKPWLLHLGRYIDSSTYLQIHLCVEGLPLGRDERELTIIAEGGLGGHKSRSRSANISCGSVVRGYPMPNRQMTWKF